MYDFSQLNEMLVPELKEMADKLNVKNSNKLNKQDLVLAILDAQAVNPNAIKEINPSATPEENNKEPKEDKPKRERRPRNTSENSTGNSKPTDEKTEVSENASKDEAKKPQENKTSI